MSEQPTSLQLSEVLNGVYEKLKAEAKIVREFKDTSARWASYSDFGRTREVDLHFNGFIAEISPQSGFLVANGELGGREWLLDFEKALFLVKISLEEKPDFKSEPLEKFWHYAHASSWEEVSANNLGRAIRSFKYNEDKNKPALFAWKSRLIFEGVEVTEHLISPPKFSDRVSQGIGAFNGILFVNDYPGGNYPGMVSAIEEPACYSPQVIDYLTAKLQEKTGINQPQLI